MAEGCKDNPAVLTVTESMGCALHKAPESLSKLPHSASFSLCPTIVSRYAQINRHTWEVYFRIYGYCKTSRNSFKLSKICSQGVTSKVLEEGPGNPAVFLAVLWRFVCFPPGGGSRWTTSGAVFHFSGAFPVSLSTWESQLGRHIDGRV